MKTLVLIALSAGAGRWSGLQGDGFGPREPGREGVLFSFGYQPWVYVSDVVDEGEGWMGSFGWGLKGRSGAVMVAYEESKHTTLATGDPATYWRLDAGYGGYLTEFPRAVAPYISMGGSVHSIGWGGAGEGLGGFGGYLGMGVDFLPTSHLFFGFDVVCHLWADQKTDLGYVTITATASVFVEF